MNGAALAHFLRSYTYAPPFNQARFEERQVQTRQEAARRVAEAAVIRQATGRSADAREESALATVAKLRVEAEEEVRLRLKAEEAASVAASALAEKKRDDVTRRLRRLAASLLATEGAEVRGHLVRFSSRS